MALSPATGRLTVVASEPTCREPTPAAPLWVPRETFELQPEGWPPASQPGPVRTRLAGIASIASSKRLSNALGRPLRAGAFGPAVECGLVQMVAEAASRYVGCVGPRCHPHRACRAIA